MAKAASKTPQRKGDPHLIQCVPWIPMSLHPVGPWPPNRTSIRSAVFCTTQQRDRLTDTPRYRTTDRVTPVVHSFRPNTNDRPTSELA